MLIGTKSDLPYSPIIQKLYAPPPSKICLGFHINV